MSASMTYSSEKPSSSAFSTPTKLRPAAQSLGTLLANILDCATPICSWEDLKIGSYIDRGTSMEVWSGKWQGRLVAVKKMRMDEWPQGPSSVEGGDREITQQLKAASLEVRAMSHPIIAASANIVRLLAISWTEKGPEFYRVLLPVLITELAYLKHPTLDKFMPNLKLRQLGHKAALLNDILEGLQAIHNCSIVMGDVKPQNVLIFEDSTRASGFIAKLSDFGFSQGDSDSPKPAGGTGYWNAPECVPPEDCPGGSNIISQWSVDKRRDIYSFGLLASYLLTGEKPFGSDSKACWEANRATINAKKMKSEVIAVIKSAIVRHLRLRRYVQSVDLAVPDPEHGMDSLSKSIKSVNIALLAGAMKYEVYNEGSEEWEVADGYVPYGYFAALGITVVFDPANRPLIPALLSTWGFKWPYNSEELVPPFPGVPIVGQKVSSEGRSLEGTGAFSYDRIPADMRTPLFQYFLHVAEQPGCDALFMVYISDWYNAGFGVEQNEKEAQNWLIKAAQAPAKSAGSHTRLCKTVLRQIYKVWDGVALEEDVERRLLATWLFYEEPRSFIEIPWDGSHGALCNMTLESTISTTTMRQEFLRGLNFPVMVDEDFGDLNKLTYDEIIALVRPVETPEVDLPDQILEMQSVELMGLARYSCFGRLFTALKKIIRQWPDLLRMRESHGLTLLQLATLDEDFAGVGLLSQAGADPACLFETSFIRHICAWSSDFVISYISGLQQKSAARGIEYDLKGAIDAKGELSGPFGPTSVPAMHAAIQSHNLRTVLTMMDTGLNMELAASVTPLWMAVQLLQPLMVAALCVHGANANSVLHGYGYHIQPLHYACSCQSKEPSQLLEKLEQYRKLTEAGTIPTPSAVGGTDDNANDDNDGRLCNEVCDVLITFGNADANAIDSQGMTPLLYCCREGRTSTAQVLIAAAEARSQVVDFTICDNNGLSPLHHAVLCGSADLIRLCLNSQPDLLDRKSRLGLSPLELGRQHAVSSEIIELLKVR